MRDIIIEPGRLECEPGPEMQAFLHGVTSLQSNICSGARNTSNAVVVSAGLACLACIFPNSSSKENMIFLIVLVFYIITGRLALLAVINYCVILFASQR